MKLRLFFTEKALPALYGFALLFLTGACLWGSALEQYEGLYGAGRLLYIGCLLFLLPAFIFLYRRSRSTGLQLLVFAYLWLLLTRILHGDVRVEATSSLVYVFLFCAFFAVGASFDRACAARLLRLFAGIFCAALSVSGVLGLTVLFPLSLRLPAALQEQFRLVWEIHDTDTLYYVAYFHYNRNISGIFFAVALGLAAYLWFSCKKRRLRLLLLPVCACLLLAIALQRSRSGYLSASVCIALWAGLGLGRCCRAKGLRRKVLLTLTAAACAVLVYVSLGAASDRFFAAAARANPEQYAEGTASADETPDLASEDASPGEQSDPSQAPEQPSVVDPRSLKQDSFTLNGRAQIWAALFAAVREKPSILLYGTTEGLGMYMVNKYLPGDGKEHMHNMLLEPLLLAGLPACLLLAALLVLLLRRMLPDYYSPAPAEDLPRRSLLCLLAAVMTYGILEPAFSSPRLTSLAFFLAAGIYLGRRKDIPCVTP